jgi:DNA-binding transcriptional LysR family regulator
MNDFFKIPSADCAFLSELNKHGSLSNLCSERNIDKGFASRKLSRIANLAAVLEKVNGKWELTQMGVELINWYQEASEKQKSILNAQAQLRIATTQIISERIISPVLDKLKKDLELEKMAILSGFVDVEHALLSRQIDCAIFCSIPKTPEIRYKKVFKYPLVLVAPYGWDKNISDPVKLLKDYPYVSHTQMNMRGMLRVEENVPPAVIEFDHISGVRQAIIQGIGWSILPLYAIADEITRKQVICLNAITLPHNEEFQLWWVPGRLNKKTISAFINQLSH